MLIALLLATQPLLAEPAPEETVYEFNIEEIIRQHTYSDDPYKKHPPCPTPQWGKRVETFRKGDRDPKTGKIHEDSGFSVKWGP